MTLKSHAPRQDFRAVRSLLAWCLLAACTVSILAGWSGDAHAIAYISRPEIIARAESAIGSSYTWGAESWVPDRPAAGPDCSGFVLKCWQVPRTMLYQEEHGYSGAVIQPRYTTYHFDRNLGPWYDLSSRSELAPGDALVHRWDTGGHIVLYAGGDPWGQPVIYEAPYSGALVRRTTRYLGSGYDPKRRQYVSGNAIVLDNPTARSTEGSDVGGNWQRSTSTPGYWGSDYQYRAATSARSYARWTPRLPHTGYYTVYMRWPSWWNRATNAKVTINTATGQRVTYVNQRENGNRWVSLGRHYFRSGYEPGSGSVAIHATGANGYVIADAVLFAP